MVTQTKNSTIKFAVIALTTLISIKLWSFSLIEESIMNALEISVLSLLVVIVVYNFNKIEKRPTIFKANVHLFILLPFLSAFGALVFHRQPFSLSLIVLRMNFYWLLYFILHVFEIPVKKVITLMIITGCGWIFLTSVQQFTYPRYYFFAKDDESRSILRAGVYRFMVTGHHYGLFVLLYFFYRYLVTSKMYNLLFVAMGLAGFYYYGTRQFAISAIVCLLLSIFFVKSASRFKIIFLMISTFFILFTIGGIFMSWSIKDSFLDPYIKMTNEQLQYGDDIRLRSAKFFLYEYWPHWLTKIIGNGQAYGKSLYGTEMEIIKAKYHFYRSDVGIIGALNQFGFLYALNILWVNGKALLGKYYSYETKYLRLFYVNAIFLLVLSEYYSNGIGIPFYCFVFYLTDKSFEEKRLTPVFTEAMASVR